MGKKAPSPPDYVGAAEQSAQASEQAMRDQTYANRIDQNNPWGSIGYETYQDIDPASGESVTRWRQNQTLTPEAQAALDSQMAVQQGRSGLAEGMLGDISQDYGQRMDFDKYGDPIGMGDNARMGGAGEGIQTGLDGQNLEKNLDYSGAPDVNAPQWTREAAETSVYNRGASRLDPQIAQEAQALDVKLRSQGLQPGDEAYKAQMNNFERRKTDAYDALNASAMQEGARQAESMFGMESQYRDQSTGEEDRMKDFRNNALLAQFGIGQAQGQFANQAQQQAFSQMMNEMGYNQNLGFRENALANALRTQGMNEDMTERSYRLNELNSLLSGQQVNAPGFNSFANQGAAQSADYLGAADMGYQSDMAKFGADQAGMNALMGGVGQGIGMMGMFSDRRLKKNIKYAGEINGNNWYTYDYLWDADGTNNYGVMADEVPHAAFEHPSGFLMVDYSKV